MLAQKGNGLPSGMKKAYNLEVIAYSGDNCPSGDFTESNTHRIAVKADVNDNPNGVLLSALVRQNDIMLAEGPDFRVLDGNACNDGVAQFQLPANPCAEGGIDAPCPVDDPTFQEYQVWARLVGKPDTGVNVTTCATDPGADLLFDTADDYVRCSTESWVSVRKSGKDSAPKFSNVSKQLLSICADTTVPADGRCDVRYALFASAFQDYFWNWNTTGKAHAQLFFLAVPD